MEPWSIRDRVQCSSSNLSFPGIHLLLLPTYYAGGTEHDELGGVDVWSCYLFGDDILRCTRKEDVRATRGVGQERAIIARQQVQQF